MLPSILDFAMARCSISSAVSGPSFSNAEKITHSYRCQNIGNDKTGANRTLLHDEAMVRARMGELRPWSGIQPVDTF